MKHFLPLLLIATLGIATLSSCEKSETITGASCTIMVYGSGGSGSNMDLDQVKKLIDVVNEGQNSRVHFVMAYNFRPSTADANLKYVTGTPIIIVRGKASPAITTPDISAQLKQCASAADSTALISTTCDQILSEMVDRKCITIYKINGENRVALHDPGRLAKFIDEICDRFRSERYILSITGHGGGWNAYDDYVETKAVAWDDNFARGASDSWSISAINLTNGILRSSYKSYINCLYLDASRMNMLENIYEYAKTGIPHVIASLEDTDGCNYSTLMSKLKATENTDTCFYSALDYALTDIYCSGTKTSGAVDISLQKITSLSRETRELAELFKKEYPANAQYYDKLIAGLQSPAPGSPIKDFSEFVYKLSQAPEGVASARLKSLAGIIYATMSDQVTTYYGSKSPIKDHAFTGVNFIGKNEYAKWCQKGLLTEFEFNAFYSSTGWNTIFEILNDQTL